MARHVVIDLSAMFNGWAYWTHYEKKMNMPIQDSDGGTCASSDGTDSDGAVPRVNEARHCNSYEVYLVSRYVQMLLLSLDGAGLCVCLHVLVCMSGVCV